TDNACTGPGTLAARRFNPVMPSAVRLSKGPYLALIAEELGRSRRRSRVAGRYNLVLCPACESREPVRSACTGGSSGPYSPKVQQPTWIPEDSCGRPEMVTCTDVLLWTSCHCMACKSWYPCGTLRWCENGGQAGVGTGRAAARWCGFAGWLRGLAAGVAWVWQGAGGRDERCSVP